MNIAEVGENVLVKIGRELFKRGSQRGQIVNMQLVYPLPQRTTVRPLPADTLCVDPTKKDWQLYDQAYSRPA
jgi:hypothetical protein